MLQGYTVGEASRYLHIDAKTLHRRCKQLGIVPYLSSHDGRVKLYSQEQLTLLSHRTTSVSPHAWDTQVRQDKMVAEASSLQVISTRLGALAKEFDDICQLLKQTISGLST